MPEPSTLPPCHGLIAAWRLRPGMPPLALQAEEVHRAVLRGEEGLWLHFDLVDARARAFLAALPDLPAPAPATLVEPDEHVRLEEAEGALFGVLPDFFYDEEPGASPMGVLHFALTPSLLVTARRHPLRGAHAALRQPAASSAPEALAALLRAILGELGRAIAALGDRLGRVEDAMLRPGGGEVRAELAALRREALRLARQFGPLAQVAEMLREEAPPWCEPTARREARQALATLRTLDSLQERARLAQEALASVAAQEMNRRLLVLSILSAALLPASLVAGIFGMNVTGVPGVDEPGGFALALGVIAASVAGILGALRLLRLL